MRTYNLNVKPQDDYQLIKLNVSNRLIQGEIVFTGETQYDDEFELDYSIDIDDKDMSEDQIKMKILESIREELLDKIIDLINNDGICDLDLDFQEEIYGDNCEIDYSIED